MSNDAQPIHELLNHRVEHDFGHEKGIITEVREDIRGYNYFVQWDLYPENNDWYAKNVLTITPSSGLEKQREAPMNENNHPGTYIPAGS
jgi:hypothetical protein